MLKQYRNFLQALVPAGASNIISVSTTLLILASCAHHNDTIGYYKVGKPYKIAGKTYVPKEQPDYDEVGIASWYGSDFHKKATANGGTFDQGTITAAHRTLPLPCMVRVTNLKNKKTLIVMVNDRGPFAKERILDVSERAAEILGFKNSGSTKVRVEYLPAQTKRLLADMPASKKKALLAEKTNSTKDLTIADKGGLSLISSANAAEMPKVENVKNNLDAANNIGTTQANPENSIPATGQKPQNPEEKIEEINVPAHYVQAGIYSMDENARRVERNLASLGTVNITQVKLNGKILYKVNIGPILDKKLAELTLKKTINLGHPDAMLVTK